MKSLLLIIVFCSIAQLETVIQDSLYFNVIMKMTMQGGGGCGVWWGIQGNDTNKAKLVIEYSENSEKKSMTFQHGLNGMENAYSYYYKHSEFTHYPNQLHEIRVKKEPARNGLFLCNITDIPVNATIEKATLTLHLNTNEGLGWTCKDEVIEIHHCTKIWNPNTVNAEIYDTDKKWDSVNGDFGEHILTLKSAEMHIGEWNKNNPTGSIDFTDYVRKLQLSRNGLSNMKIINSSNPKQFESMQNYLNPATSISYLRWVMYRSHRSPIFGL